MKQLHGVQLIPFESIKYNIIYADPPWKYDNQNTGGTMKSGSKDKYPVMSLQDIRDIPIKKIADKNSVLFLWATVPMLLEALDVMKHWGYKYKTKITWHKTGRNGLGFWFRGEVEELLLGVRGSVKAFRCQEPNHVTHKVLKHSEKPDVFRKKIERATVNMPNPRKIELFARNIMDGWRCVGNEINNKKDIQTELLSING